MTEPRLDRWDGRAVAVLCAEWEVSRVEAYGTLGSTNDRARVLAEEGGGPWTVVVADEQTRGRGRRGSTWVSAPGAGLSMSVLLDGGATGGTLSLLVGLACARAIEDVAPGLTVGIKWPNDLLVQGRKVGGILCEAAGDSVVAGIGINVAGAPSDAEVAGDGLPPASLEALAGNPLSRSGLARAIVRRIREVVSARSPTATGLDDALVEALNRRDALAGLAVTTDQAGEGRAAGIDVSGALRLVGDDGVELRVVSGSVRPVSGGGPIVDDPE